MKKNIWLSILVQTGVFGMLVSTDFLLWQLGFYCIYAPAIFMFLIFISGIIFLPKKKLAVGLILSLVFMLLSCFVPKVEFAYSIINKDKSVSMVDLLLDTEFEKRLSSHTDDNYTNNEESGFLRKAISANSPNKSARELYKDRRYDFTIMPILCIFVGILISIVYLYYHKKPAK